MYLGAHMLRSIVRTVLLALTLAGGGVFMSVAHAAFPPTSQAMHRCGGWGWHSTEAAAIAAWIAGVNSPRYGEPRYISGGRCYSKDTESATLFQANYEQQSQQSCPTNSTLSGGQCHCDAGFEEQGSSCVPITLCEVGKARTVNVTIGWARSSRPDADDLAIDYGAPSFFDYNDGVCVGDMASVDSCWRSQEPHSNGLYRVSCDMTMLMKSDAMTSGDPNADPLTAEPSCPGFLGEINGKAACVGTAGSPLPSDPMPSGTPSAQPGNPTSGEKPTTGEGSGSTGADRTPSAGSGGNDGGPASSAVRPGWTSPTPGEDTGQPCGGPGQPVCSVRVDETGTPTSAAGIFDGAGSGVDEQSGILTGLLGTIEEWDIGSWTWTFALPTGCTPFETYLDVVIDPCQWMAEVHDIMSVLWILTGIAGLFAIYSRAF